jgi:hypothetical protein
MCIKGDIIMEFKINNLIYEIENNCISFKNVSDICIIKGTFNDEKINEFINKIREIIPNTKECFKTSCEILAEIMENEKITHITYKELSQSIKKDFSQDILSEMIESKWYETLTSAVIETPYSKLMIGIERKKTN